PARGADGRPRGNRCRAHRGRVGGRTRRRGRRLPTRRTRSARVREPWRPARAPAHVQRAERTERERLSGRESGRHLRRRRPRRAPLRRALRPRRRGFGLRRWTAGFVAAPVKPTFFVTPTDFRAWLEEHHVRAAELWVGFHKKAT